MKKIFIYYSLTGNGDCVSKLFNSDTTIRKIETIKQLPKFKIFQILVGGFQTLIDYRDPLRDFDNNIEDYDEIIIGSPIWNDRLATPVRSAIEKLNLKDKKITFVLYSGSGKANKASEFIKKNYTNDIIILKEPLKNITELNKLRDKLK